MVQVEVLSRPPANGAMVLPLRAPATELSRREFPFTVLCSKAQRWCGALHTWAGAAAAASSTSAGGGSAGWSG